MVRREQMLSSLIEHLVEKGERITPIRRALLYLFLEYDRPLTVPEILSALNKKDINANKTTVYRQLETLERYTLVHEILFTDNVARYELSTPDDHHHHLVCLRCKNIEDLSLPNDTARQEKAIWRKNGFKVLRHSLEFFGLCRKCQL